MEKRKDVKNGCGIPLLGKVDYKDILYIAG